MKRPLWFGAALLVTTVAVTSCSAGTSSGSSSVSGQTLPQKGALQAAPAALPADAAGGSSGSSGSGGRVLAGSKAVVVSDVESRIRTVNLTVAVRGAKNVASRADRAEAVVLAAGGDVDTDDRTTGADASAQLHLRVPPAALTSVLSTLSKLGTEVERTATSRDVTGQVADVSSRVASAERAIARLRLLYTKATKVGEIISIEDELSSRESDLEALQAQQRALAHQVEKASVVLSLQTAGTAVVPPTKRTGFLGGLQRGWHNFLTAATALAGGIGASLPFLVLLVLLGAGARLLWPHLPRRRASGGSDPTPEPAAGA